MVLDGLSLLWLATGALLLVSTYSWAEDQASCFYTYPGALYPITCWALLIAAVATPVAVIFAFLRLRPTDWSRWSWIRNGVTLIVYAVLIATLFEWRLLGFS
jgi:hypothetical protein